MNSGALFDKAEQAIIAGDAATLEQLLPALREQSGERPWYGKRPNPTWLPAEDATSTLLREHHVETPDALRALLEARADASSPVARFEYAVDAIVEGDIASLQRALAQDSRLVHARSIRKHGATLLHYIGANGVEGFRQRTPANAVEITELLLSAGSDVNALAHMYGNDTTLGLVATSIHPKRAGVQIALLRTLIDNGATIDDQAVNACLANGRREAAEFLASRGARLDFEGAAGVGDLDLVRSSLQHATPTGRERAFDWACEYGRNAVIEFLLASGIDIGAGLHCAVIGGEVDTIRLLLAHGASLEARNQYDGTVLGQAVWCAYHGDSGIDYVPIIRLLIDAGANVETLQPYIEDILSRKL